MAKKTDSPALQFVRLLYREGQQATDHSWTRLNAALSEATAVAIRGGLCFDLGDFKAFYSDLNAGYWIGSHPSGFYRLACEYGNLSACKAYEHCYGFKPYELEGQRVFVGHDFNWNGERVTCTSISKESLVACSYKPSDPDGYRSKILHRYSITNAEMAAESKKRQGAALDQRMAKARDAAAKYANDYRLNAEALKRHVADVLPALDDDYRKRSIEELVKRRFKKADKPTVMDLLVVALRWRAEYHAGTAAVRALCAQGATPQSAELAS